MSTSDLMYAQMGVSIISGIGNYMVGSIQADMQQAAQDYRNRMSDLAAGQNLNANLLNEIGARDESVRESLSIQVAAMKQEGAAEVAAGAAGVKGTTVDLTAKRIRAAAVQANFARLQSLRNQYAGFSQERRNILVGAAMNKDISVIPRPSAGAALLGIGTNMLKVYQNYLNTGKSQL